MEGERQQVSDHDLLIELRVEVKRMNGILEKFTDSIMKRVENLENWKAYLTGGMVTITILLSLVVYVYTTQQAAQDARIDQIAKTISK